MQNGRTRDGHHSGLVIDDLTAPLYFKPANSSILARTALSKY